MEQSNSKESRKLTVTFANQGVVKTVEGEFVPRKIEDSKSAYAATLHMILKHTADVYLTIVDIIAEKYGHSAEEMTETILAHPKFSEMYTNPMIHDLGYVESKAPTEEQKRLEAKAKLKAKRMAKDISGSSMDALTESMGAISIEPAAAAAATQEEPKKMVTVKRIKKKEPAAAVGT